MHSKQLQAMGRRFLETQAWWALGSLWLAVVLWAFLNGQRLHGINEQNTLIKLQAEDHVVCERLGMPFEGPSYPVCASALGEVRMRQKLRTEHDVQGLL